MGWRRKRIELTKDRVGGKSDFQMRNIFIFFQICQLEGKIIQLTSFYLLPACESNIKHLFYFLNDLYASKQVQNNWRCFCDGRTQCEDKREGGSEDREQNRIEQRSFASNKETPRIVLPLTLLFQLSLWCGAANIKPCILHSNQERSQDFTQWWVGGGRYLGALIQEKRARRIVLILILFSLNVWHRAVSIF